MTALEIGRRLVELINAHKVGEQYSELYSNDVVAIEADGSTVKGLDAINAKNEWWMKTFDTTSAKVEGPFPNGDDFILIFDMELMEKATGKKSSMREAALYTTKGGKIVSERFFYIP